MTLTKYGIVKSIVFPICLVKKLRLSGEPASRVVFYVAFTHCGAYERIGHLTIAVLMSR